MYFEKKTAEEAEISNDIAPPIGTKQNKTKRIEPRWNETKWGELKKMMK